MLGRGIHTLIRHTSFSSPVDVGLHNPPPKGAQRPHWHIDPGSGSDTICNSADHPLARYCPLWHTRPHGFAFDSSDDSRSPQHPLLKTRHARESPDHPPARYCPFWHTSPHGLAFEDRDNSRNPPHSLVKTCHAREKYPYPYKACFVLFPNRCGTSQSTP
ncbi:hypothetical protein PIB30_005715 [Stylosanthes scabra]|uniref:Uncharacterized protein n=1 Tax=Stylosanthes scabra TaxID=79078 RepID=A0ABU6V737_9FABA|nr:hypothetical protein [Stylosanthes scabra]